MFYLTCTILLNNTFFNPRLYSISIQDFGMTGAGNHSESMISWLHSFIHSFKCVISTRMKGPKNDSIAVQRFCHLSNSEWDLVHFLPACIFMYRCVDVGMCVTSLSKTKRNAMEDPTCSLDNKGVVQQLSGLALQSMFFRAEVLTFSNVCVNTGYTEVPTGI